MRIIIKNTDKKRPPARTSLCFTGVLPSLVSTSAFWYGRCSSSGIFWRTDRLSWRVAHGKGSTGCQERSCQFSLVYDPYKYYWNAVFWKHSSTSASLPVGDRSAEWLPDFETPTSIITDLILNNHYLTQTMENNARSGVKRVQEEMSFIFIFPSVVRIEKNCVVFWVLDQSRDYVNRSSKRLCLMNCFHRSSERG